MAAKFRMPIILREGAAFNSPPFSLSGDYRGLGKVSGVTRAWEYHSSHVCKVSADLLPQAFVRLVQEKGRAVLVPTEEQRRDE